MRTKKGHITSTKMTGTVAVEVKRSIVHPKYKKRYSLSTKFLAAIGDQKLNEGDYVEIQETRPLSKRKRWTVTRVITKAKGVQDDGVLAVESEVKHEKDLAEKKERLKEEKASASAPAPKEEDKEDK